MGNCCVKGDTSAAHNTVSDHGTTADDTASARRSTRTKNAHGERSSVPQEVSIPLEGLKKRQTESKSNSVEGRHAKVDSLHTPGQSSSTRVLQPPKKPVTHPSKKPETLEELEEIGWIANNFSSRGRSEAGISSIEELPRSKTPNDIALLDAQSASDRKYGKEADEFKEIYLRYEGSISSPQEDDAVLPGIRKFSIPLSEIAGFHISRGCGLLPSELEGLRTTLLNEDLEENRRLTKFHIHSNGKRGGTVQEKFVRSGLTSTTTWDPKAVAYSKNRVRRLNPETGKVEIMAIRTVFDILIDENSIPRGYVSDKVLLGPHNEIVLSDENTYTTIKIADPDTEGITRVLIRASWDELNETPAD